MKKNKIIMLILICILLLCGCDNVSHGNQNIKKNNIIAIEMNENQNLNYNSEFIKGAKSNLSDEYKFKVTSELNDEAINGYIIDLESALSDFTMKSLENLNGKIIFCVPSKNMVNKIVTDDTQYTVISYNEESIGKQLAEYIGKISVNKPDINILNIYSAENSQIKVDEFNAYTNELSKNPKTKVLENLSLSDDENSYEILKKKISLYKKIDVIYVRNPDMAVKTSEVLKELGKTDTAIISGFVTENIIDKIESGDITAGISRIPYHLGKIAGENMIKLLNNEKISDIILESTIVTKDNTASIKFID